MSVQKTKSLSIHYHHMCQAHIFLTVHWGYAVSGPMSALGEVTVCRRDCKSFEAKHTRSGGSEECCLCDGDLILH